jgi:hypothetical protein
MILHHGPGLRAAVLVAAALAAALALAPPSSKAAEPSPIKIAVFDFELNDTSGGSGIIPQDAVDTSAAGSAPKGGYQSCRGCESGVASKLGADQSMVGLVTRLNRVEHAVQIVVRDARTGALVSNHYTGLRMGANYAWPRAVKWLVENSVLAARHTP